VPLASKSTGGSPAVQRGRDHVERAITEFAPSVFSGSRPGKVRMRAVPHEGIVRKMSEPTEAPRVPEHGAARQTRIVIADDHPVVRRALRLLLGKHGMEVLEEAADIPSARAAVMGHRPDVLLLDLRLPNGSTRELLSELAARAAATHVLVLSADKDPRSVRALMAAGAHGYVSKAATEQELTEAVKAVATGRVYVSPDLGAALVRPREGRLKHVEPDDVEVLRLIALGHTAREIAETLGFSQRHAEWRRSRLEQLLMAPNRAALVRIAIEEGLLPDATVPASPAL
jgi:two-component system response regulator NreC